MNIREFKAWLEGFEEAIEGKPNAVQWKKIKEKLALVTESPTYQYITYTPLYPTWYQPWGGPTTFPATITCDATSNASTSWYELGQLEARQ